MTTDHLTAILDAATCPSPVACRNGHRRSCLDHRRVAVQDALGKALTDAAVVEAAGEALDGLLPARTSEFVTTSRLVDAALAAAVEALGGAS